jgi:hypothetical protein
MSTCVDTLGPGPDNVLCPSEHCDQVEQTDAYHQVCDCIDWQGNPIPDCTPKDNLYPVQSAMCFNPDTNVWQDMKAENCMELGAPWYFRTCYCCCPDRSGSEADAGSVAVPEGERPVADVQPGDEVETGTRGYDGGLAWVSREVGLAAGVGPASAVRVLLDDGRATVAESGRLFLQPSGKLKRADALEAGVDVLVAPDGRPVAVRSVEHGRAAVRRVAAAVPSYEEFDGPDGHLLAIDGVVAGDYVTQLYQGTDKMAAHVEAPAARGGTREEAVR